MAKYAVSTCMCAALEMPCTGLSGYCRLLQGNLDLQRPMLKLLGHSVSDEAVVLFAFAPSSGLTLTERCFSGSMRPQPGQARRSVPARTAAQLRRKRPRPCLRCCCGASTAPQHVSNRAPALQCGQAHLMFTAFGHPSHLCLPQLFAFRDSIATASQIMKPHVAALVAHQDPGQQQLEALAPATHTAIVLTPAFSEFRVCAMGRTANRDGQVVVTCSSSVAGSAWQHPGAVGACGHDRPGRGVRARAGVQGARRRGSAGGVRNRTRTAASWAYTCVMTRFSRHLGTSKQPHNAGYFASIPGDKCWVALLAGPRQPRAETTSRLDPGCRAPATR